MGAIKGFDLKDLFWESNQGTMHFFGPFLLLVFKLNFKLTRAKGFPAVFISTRDR